MLIDTHCHLLDEPLRADIDGVVERAADRMVERLLVPTVCRADWEDLKTLGNRKGILTAFGVHPWKASEGVDEALLEEALAGASAVGEIGLDWKVQIPKTLQLDCLEIQLRLARKLDLPVLLHCRGAFGELLELLSSIPITGGVLHGYSRSPEQMHPFLDLGFCMGFGGAVTRSGARNARASAAAVPDGRFVLETDSPWIGVEGGPSEPSSLPLVACAMASIRGVTPARIASDTTSTAMRVLGCEP
ncbi:MAG: TatD family hydrolase [Candidatus Fermentibacteraceae bacterium]